MNGAFNGQILVEKLAKLNISQQSIETLSHWCIFHRTKARQVVETWDQQFHFSPREQRLSFLYLANDILQNSRRKGAEFVGEFWKVLPDALGDVIENGDESERNAAIRLINIWEERKVFGSRGRVLKEELVGRNLENGNRNGKVSGIKSKLPVGNMLEKVISSYEVVYDAAVDEEALMSKCKTAVHYVDKVDKEIGNDYSSGKLSGSEFTELQGQQSVLRACTEQLKAIESTRETLLSHLREVLQEQEFKLDQVRTQLQDAQARCEQAGNICQQLMNNNVSLLPEHVPMEVGTLSDMPSRFTPETQTASEEKEQSIPVMYTPRAPPNNPSLAEDDSIKSAAAAVVAKLTASTSSHQMLTFAFSSLASEAITGNQLTEPSAGDYPPEKKPKLENGQPSYTPPPHHTQPPPPQHAQPPPPPLPPFPCQDLLQHNAGATSQPLTQQQPPPPPPPSSSPMRNPGPTMLLPLQPPLPPHSSQIMQTAGAMTSVPYSYGLPLQRAPPPLPGYPTVGPPPLTGMSSSYSSPGPYQSFQGSEGSGFHNQPPLPASPAISRP